MKKGLLTIAEVLRANGYETVAFTSATTTRSTSTGLQVGFDRYIDSLVPWSTLFSRDEFENLVFFYLIGVAQRFEICGELVSDRPLHWLESRTGDGPFFAWLHYFDPHSPYDAPQPYRDMYRGVIQDGRPMSQERERYAAEITYTDAQLHRVIADLKRRGWYDDTTVIVAADHGEAFGETHGPITEVRHGGHLYDTTQHVPLIVKAAGVRDGGLRVSEQVGLTDIFPTILRWLELEGLDELPGKPIDELVNGRSSVYPGRQAHAFNMVSVVDPKSGKQAFFDQAATRTPEWKYIGVNQLGSAELYNLIRDPGESLNLANRYGSTCDKHRQELAQWLGGDSAGHADPTRRLAPALVRQLKSLGYVGDLPDAN